jgi:tetratricopeptide (TPR) repeat protein
MKESLVHKMAGGIMGVMRSRRETKEKSKRGMLIVVAAILLAGGGMALYLLGWGGSFPAERFRGFVGLSKKDQAVQTEPSVPQPPPQSARPPAGQVPTQLPQATASGTSQQPPGAPLESRPVTLREANRLRMAGDLTGAEEVLTEFVEQHPDNTEGIVALANLYLKDLKDPGKALPFYAWALTQEPERASLQVSMGVCYLRMGEAEQAMEYFQRAASLDPNLAEAHYDLARAYALEGDRDAAEGALRVAAALDPRIARRAKDDPDLALLRSGGTAPVKNHEEATESPSAPPAAPALPPYRSGPSRGGSRSRGR